MYAMSGTRRYGDYGSDEPRPPTEKQAGFAQRLAAERGVQVPPEAMETSMTMSSFIESMLQQQEQQQPAGSANYQANVFGSDEFSMNEEERPPTEKQAAFAHRLADEAGVMVPQEALTSSVTASQFIDGMLQQRQQQRSSGGFMGQNGQGGSSGDLNGEMFLEVDLGRLRNLRVRTFAGRVMVDLREFYESRDGVTLLPTKKGIALTHEQWQALRRAVNEVDAAVAAATASVEEPPLQQPFLDRQDGQKDTELENPAQYLESPNAPFSSQGLPDDNGRVPF